MALGENQLEAISSNKFSCLTTELTNVYTQNTYICLKHIYFEFMISFSLSFYPYALIVELEVKITLLSATDVNVGPSIQLVCYR